MRIFVVFDPGSYLQMTERIPPEFRRVEATVEYKAELDQELERLYPFLGLGDQALWAQFQQTDGPLVSFRVPDQEPDFLAQVLEIALIRASNPQDSVAFSEHGAEHETFKTASDRLLADLRSGQISARFPIGTATAETVIGESVFSFRRLILETLPFQHVVPRSQPQAFAMELRSDLAAGNERAVARRIRRATYTYGPAFGILACLYSSWRVGVGGIFEFFNNQDFRRELRARGFDYPTPSRREDAGRLRNIIDLVLVPSRTDLHPSLSGEAYKQAVELLVTHEWLTPAGLKQEGFGFIPVESEVFARAVFKGMEEEAQRLTDPGFLDPVRSAHIKNHYGHLATSRLITAFLVFD